MFVLNYSINTKVCINHKGTVQDNSKKWTHISNHHASQRNILELPKTHAPSPKITIYRTSILSVSLSCFELYINGIRIWFFVSIIFCSTTQLSFILIVMCNSNFLFLSLYDIPLYAYTRICLHLNFSFGGYSKDCCYEHFYMSILKHGFNVLHIKSAIVWL